MPSQPLLCNVCSFAYDVHSWSGRMRVAIVPTDCTVTTEKVVQIIPDCWRLEELSTKYIPLSYPSKRLRSAVSSHFYEPTVRHTRPAGHKITL